MAGQVPETRAELEGRAPDDPVVRPHLRLWEALLFLGAGLFLLSTPGPQDVWSLLRGGGLTLVGMAALAARPTRVPARIRRAAPLVALAGILAWLVGAVAWLVKNVL